MVPLWHRATERGWLPNLLISVGVVALASVVMWISSAAMLAGILVVGSLAWPLATGMRLSLGVALLWPLLLLAVAAQTWPWAEIVVLLCGLWLSEVAARRQRQPLPVDWQSIKTTAKTSLPGWVISAAAMAAVAIILWCGETWLGMVLLSAGALTVAHETGQVRRTLITVAGGMLTVRGLLPDAHGLVSLLPLAVPVMRAAQVPLVCILPGAAGVALVSGGLAWTPPMAIIAALLLAGWLWDHLDYAVRPAWRILSPSWRWFTYAKLVCDPLYASLAADPRPWGRVLDLGCGSGLAAVVAARRSDVAMWLGIDLDARKIEVARQLLAATPGTAHWQTLVAHLPLVSAIPSAPFDTVLALDILHYWPFSQQAELLAWMRAQVAPGGRLWLRDGASEAAGSTQVQRGERFTTAIGLNPPSALFFRTTAEWEAAFVQAGFMVCSCQPSGAANRLWCLEAPREQISG